MHPESAGQVWENPGGDTWSVGSTKAVSHLHSTPSCCKPSPPGLGLLAGRLGGDVSGPSTNPLSMAELKCTPQDVLPPGEALLLVLGPWGVKPCMEVGAGAFYSCRCLWIRPPLQPGPRENVPRPGCWEPVQLDPTGVLG